MKSLRHPLVYSKINNYKNIKIFKSLESFGRIEFTKKRKIVKCYTIFQDFFPNTYDINTVQINVFSSSFRQCSVDKYFDEKGLR